MKCSVCGSEESNGAASSNGEAGVVCQPCREKIIGKDKKEKS